MESEIQAKLGQNIDAVFEKAIKERREWERPWSEAEASFNIKEEREKIMKRVKENRARV